MRTGFAVTLPPSASRNSVLGWANLSHWITAGSSACICVVASVFSVLACFQRLRRIACVNVCSVALLSNFTCSTMICSSLSLGCRKGRTTSGETTNLEVRLRTRFTCQFAVVFLRLFVLVCTNSTTCFTNCSFCSVVPGCFSIRDCIAFVKR